MSGWERAGRLIAKLVLELLHLKCRAREMPPHVPPQRLRTITPSEDRTTLADELLRRKRQAFHDLHRIAREDRKVRVVLE
jgi:hypothetical protein